jgi:hypothetical protein
MNNFKDKTFYFDFEEPGLFDITPIKKHIPKWYKDIKSQTSTNIAFNDQNLVYKNAKNCVPFLDSISSGYTITLNSDIYVTKQMGQPFFRWQVTPNPMDIRPDDDSIPVPAGHSSINCIWLIPYSFKLPTGYSALFTHPLNRHDLPFTSLSGIVDLDNGMNGGNFPFFIRDDFEGIIPAGTPIVQIIPFKRESWVSKRDETLSKKTKILGIRSLRVFFNFYKNNLWHKKSYE